MKKKIIILIIVIFLLIGISLGTYFYVIKNINKETKSTKTVINSSTNEEIVLNDESYEITKGGTYTFTGKISNGSITTNTDDEVMGILASKTVTVTSRDKKTGRTTTKEVSAKLARNTYYKYKRELKEGANNDWLRNYWLFPVYGTARETGAGETRPRERR